MHDENWPVCQFCELIVGKPRHGLYKPPEFFGEGTPIIKMGTQSDYDFIDDSLIHDFVKIDEHELERFQVRKDDLLFLRTSLVWEGTGKCSIVVRLDQPMVFISNLIAVTLNKEKADPLYYFYYFSSERGHNHVLSMCEQTAAATIRGSDLQQLEVPFPPVSEQRGISQTLFALDRKIEHNSQINKSCERLASLIFKKWFVDFEFPNEEGKPFKSSDGEMIDSELGKIPKGWKIGEVGDIATNYVNIIHPPNVSPSTLYVGLEHITRKSLAMIDYGVATDVTSNKFRFREKDILFGKLRPYFHKVSIANDDGICSTDILVISPKESLWYGFTIMHVSSTELVNYADSMSTGTKMPRTNWVDISHYRIALPPEKIAEQFNDLLAPLFELMMCNVRQSRLLTSLKTKLLPKLLSGQISVKPSEGTVSK